MKTDISRPAMSPLGAFRTLIDLLSSIRLGIFLLALIIVYSTVGSAIPPTRQFFELTEFEFFNHWVFVALIGLFALNLTVATVRRIPFNLRNAGVLTVHTGLLLLCAGSVVYFGNKIEGDIILNSPHILVQSVSRAQTGQHPTLASFAATEGNTWSQNMPALGGKYDIRVVGVRHRGMVTAAHVDLEVRIGDAEPKSVSLSQSDGTGAARHPEFANITDQIVLQLVPANSAKSFYDYQTALLTIDYAGESYPIELPELPYYRERFVSGPEQIRDTAGKEVQSDRTSPMPVIEKWDMPIPLARSGSAASADLPFDAEIDGYLPYAEMRSLPVPGGQQVNPMLRVLYSGDPQPDGRWAVAMIPEHSMVDFADGSTLEFRWLPEGASLDANWTSKISGAHVIDVFVKDKDVRRQYDVREGQKIAVEGTEYELTIEQLMPSWPLMTASHKNARTPTALIWVKSPAQEFQRSVLQRYAELNQDRDRAGKKIRDDGSLVDSNIEIRYVDASRHHYLIASGPDMAPTLVHTAPGGARQVKRLDAGQSYSAAPEATLTLAEVIISPKLVMIPEVVPQNFRRPQSDVRRGQSMVRVHLRSRGSGQWEKRVWVPFSNYNGDLDEKRPTPVELPGGDQMLLTYGRAERPLPGPVVLERLNTDFYPGGERPSGWRSFFRYVDPDSGETMCTSCWLNNTARIGNWTFYQATAANDHESFTGLGVGNRDGVFTQLSGCMLITLGLVWAFTVKPVLIKRMKRQALEAADMDSFDGNGNGSGIRGASTRRPVPATVSALVLLPALLVASRPARAAESAPSEGQAAAQSLRDIQDQIDVKRLGALVVQYNARFSSVEAWGRDMVEQVHGPGKTMMGLDPVVAAMELMFNVTAYLDEPIVYVKDRGLRQNITSAPHAAGSEAGEVEIERIRKTGYVSYNFLFTPHVRAVLGEMQNDARFSKAMQRLSTAMGAIERIGESFAVVPAESGKPEDKWRRLDELSANLDEASSLPRRANLTPVPGVSAAQAEAMLTQYRDFVQAWRTRDAKKINEGISSLEASLSKLGPAGAYPSPKKRQAEVTYYRLELIWWSWLAYIFAFFVGIFAVATSYRWARGTMLVLLIAAVLLHCADLGLRWYVVGRIPNANMYEAIVFSTGCGALLGLLLEIFIGWRIFGLATAFLGFFSLALPELNVLGITNRIDTMAPILDNIMLRIHTVLIIGSYAVITLAFGVANCHLVVSAFRENSRLAQGTLGAEIGATICLAALKAGFIADPSALTFMATLTACCIAGAMVVIGATSLRFGWNQEPALSIAGATGSGLTSILTGSGAAGTLSYAPRLAERPRKILQEFDLAHRVLLYTAMVALFVGLVLGAVWADYSWGRPWGWDPKEVFALNTWLVYAILIHARFVTKNRGLWTSVLSVVGFAAMQFNWWVVNFYIVGLHSYA